jgi:hypothetical protein
MATSQFELQEPPADTAALALWLQHAVGKILFEDVRQHALDQLDPKLSTATRKAAAQAVDDALYGLMMVLDGVTGALANDRQQVELAVQVKLVDRSNRNVVAEQDVAAGDDMCMGYHGWVGGYFGETPVAVRRPGTKSRGNGVS